MHQDKTTIDISKITKGKWIVEYLAAIPKISTEDWLIADINSNLENGLEEAEANAAFIVTACNNYDRSIELLKELLDDNRVLVALEGYMKETEIMLKVESFLKSINQ